MQQIYTTIKIGLSSALLLLSLQACSEFTDIPLPNDQLNRSDIYKNANTTKAALTNIYTNLREQSFLAGNSRGLGYLMGIYTDDLQSMVDPSSNSQIFPIYNNSLLANNINISSFWNTNYNHLYAINDFIDGVSNSEALEPTLKAIYLGEAYFLRALYYHYLTQVFGDIPYVTTTDYTVNAKIGKTKVIDVLDKVEGDLKVALEFMPTVYRDPKRIFPNKAVVELLLAKNYLLQKRYDLAEVYARKVLENPDYNLELDLNKVFKRTTSNTLWQLAGNSSIDATIEAQTYIFVMFFLNQAITPSLFNAFEVGDERKTVYMKEVDVMGQNYYHPFKYKNNQNNPDEYSIVFRIEEAYLTLAEALLYQHKPSDALDYINPIRMRAGLIDLPNTLSEAVVKEELLNEYQREFFAEHGHRFLDLKRNDALNQLETNKPNWEIKHRVFPLPEQELLLNPKLLPQNDDY